MADYDLIVVGGGGAGLSAAATAAEAGCKVLVLEAAEKFGGSTAMSDGVFNAAGTSVQKALGYDDSIDAYYDYYMTLNAWRQPAGLIRTFCEQATATLEWLIGLGLSIPARNVHKVKGVVFPSSAAAPGLYAAGVEWPPRGHIPFGHGGGPYAGGAAYTDLLYQYAGSLGVELVPATRVEKLHMVDGRVAGIESGGAVVTAQAVAITCGGLCNNPELLREWFPDAYLGFDDGHVPSEWGAPSNVGDVISLGEQAGAELSGRNTGLLGTIAYFPRTEIKGFPGFQPSSLIYVNHRGQRFADETAPYAVFPGLLKAQGNMCWGIFDEGARLRADPSAAGYSQGWDPEFVLQAVASGDIRRGATLAELAGKIGAEPGALEGSVQRYNEDLPTGVDREFLRSLDGLHPIEQGPFYAFEYRPTTAFLTGAGIRINTNGEGVDSSGNPVPGLYAAGEAGAGVLGERYVGGGNSVANALTMGRVVGKSVARQLGKTAG